MLKILEAQADMALLHQWNKAYNLTSVLDPEQMLVRHIMDNIVVNPHLRGIAKRLKND